MSATGRAVALLNAWRNGQGKEHVSDHYFDADKCDRCEADRDAWDVFVQAAEIMGWAPDDRPMERDCFGGASCAVEPCDRDAVTEIRHTPGSDIVYVPLCHRHRKVVGYEELAYIVDAHGFIPAYARESGR